MGPVVQRPSISPCQGEDRRFESGRDRQCQSGINCDQIHWLLLSVVVKFV